MKNKKKTTSILDTLVPLSILVLTLFFIVYCFIQQSGVNNNIKKTISKTKFVGTKNTEVAIQFNEITTPNEVYKALKKSCKNYILENDALISNVYTDVIITESTYIDSNGNTIKINKDDTIHETGPVYLQDVLLLRYINTIGEMRIVASKYECKNDESNEILLNSLNLVNKKPENYRIITVDNLHMKDMFIDNTNNKHSVTLATNVNIEHDKIKNLYTSRTEEDYTNEISKLLVEIISNKHIDISNETKEKILEYFTYDGYSAIINSLYYIEPDDNMEVALIKLGKSDLSIDYKDRIIVQLYSCNEQDKIINMIIKLDDNHKIFDIDLL